MPRRQGATLIEVLVAIFVMGLGMIALLTLFPIGALRMAQAIQDDKCATAVANANAIATMNDVRNDRYVRSPVWYFLPNPLLDVFTDTPPTSVVPAAKARKPADPNGPSYPVYVDPVGIQNSPFGDPGQRWVCGRVAPGLIARTCVGFVLDPPNFTVNNTKVYKWFSLLDDLNFVQDPVGGGVPDAPFQRDIRYSWAYLVQRPRSADASIVNLSVVVFNKRPLSLTPALTLSEAAYINNGNTPVSNVMFDPTRNTISLDWTNSPIPNLRTGDWILDCTYVPTTLANGTPAGSAHGFFYRVVGITETGISSADYEVQQPIRGFPLPPATPTSVVGSAPYSGSIMILEGIADVFERGVDRKPH
jgi:hypothetical protein